MRRAGVIDPVTGELVPFPYMPWVAELPPGWRRFATARKIDHLIGLDRCYEIMSWGPTTGSLIYGALFELALVLPVFAAVEFTSGEQVLPWREVSFFLGLAGGFCYGWRARKETRE
jgi:hypothetical protein